MLTRNQTRDPWECLVFTLNARKLSATLPTHLSTSSLLPSSSPSTKSSPKKPKPPRIRLNQYSNRIFQLPFTQLKHNA
ncbi:hypothetical protein L5515_011963 [Caenorhabditis briggsae]|uniref:Uncharacterized protein n=1 Tax=Caenorhabditis briggsae TaxID=6238 RepID=A0AAE9EVW6_CAEBR|nr:hypothetical protein L5515_011963 [Caenorhabditis briggsae]